jgi:hypothetical protein
MRNSRTMLEPLEGRQLFSVSLLPGTAVDPPNAASAILSPLNTNPQPGNGGVSLHETVGHKTTVKLGEFFFKTIDQGLDATVDWGDGTKTVGKIEGSYATGEWYVEGAHAYQHAGTYAVKVTVFTHLVGGPNHPSLPLTQINSVITAKNLQPSNGGVSLNEPAGKKFTARLGEFTYKTVDQALDADINWGDGTHSVGKLVGSYATGEYYVQGTHTYAHAGTFKVYVRIFGHLVGGPVHNTNPLRQFVSVVHAKDDALQL